MTTPGGHLVKGGTLMTHAELETRLSELKSQIANAAPGTRHVHLDGLNRLVTDFSHHGTEVPSHLRRLQDELTNEAIEARFDNLPV